MRKTPPSTVLDLFEMGMDREVFPWDPPGGGVVPMEQLVVLNLGCGYKTFKWALNLDRNSPEADVRWQAGERLPVPDDSVDAVLAFHFLEHLQPHSILHVLGECVRVLKTEGTVNIVVPYGVSDCALQDLDHKTRFTEDTWKNTFNNPYYIKQMFDFTIGFNMIMGLNHRNLVLVTQLVKT